MDHHAGRTPLRSHVNFERGARIEQIPSDHKAHPPGSSGWTNAHLLQLADLLLGSTIRACHVGCPDRPNIPRLGTRVDDKKAIVAHPVKAMLSKVERGSGFRHSGHYRSFTVQFVDFEGDEVGFHEVSPVDVELEDHNLRLPF